MPYDRTQTLLLGIGGIILGMVCDDYTTEIEVDDVDGMFIVDGNPDMLLQVCNDWIPDLRSQEIVFDSGGLWQLRCTSSGQWVFSSHFASGDPDARQVIVLEPNFRSGYAYVENIPGIPWLARNPLLYPLGQVLTVSILSRGLGLLFHACGVIDRGRGILFAGTSGAGKSTLARLWGGREDITVLSDDRIIVRKKESRFWLYGTPWHGDVKVYSPKGAPLERIFVIKHASQNNQTKLQNMETTSSLLVRSFPPFWDKSGMEFALEFCAELSQAVPCYELGFVPDESVIDFVRSVCDGSNEDKSS